ncbi:hypothetical protein MD537_06945 [Flavihumibacter sediminis]|nr:hypothetical protein [Flavihumibacter sediminis]
MEYYKSNALYEYISARNLPQFRFVVGNAWQLVYGDNNCCPLVLILAVGVKIDQIDSPPIQAERDAFNLLAIAGANANLPVRYIRFACDVAEVENVRVSDATFTYSSLSMPELSSLFGSFRLPVSNTRTAKYLNDKTSSAYHKWQRSSLGAALTVSDIDLWRLSKTGKPEIVFELKRSYYDLGSWKPFTDDYRNFKLISNLCNMAGMQFKIIYNQRIKTPFEDKIDRLKIFTVDFSKNPKIELDGIITLDEFENI